MPASAQPLGLNPWAIYEHHTVAWRPHGGQVEVLDSNARHRVWCAGRRTGKSELGAHVLLPYGLATRQVATDWLRKGKRREYWIVGDEYVTADKEFRTLWALINHLGIEMDKGSHHAADGKSQSVISLWGGAFYVATQSGKYPENLVGESLHGVLMVEAAKSKPSLWQKHIRPMLNDYKGWSLHTSTPEGDNHFKDKFEYGQDPYKTDWDSWRMPAYLNPYVYTETGQAIAMGHVHPDTPIPEEEWTRDDHVKFLMQQMEDHPGVSAAKIALRNNLQINHEIVSLADELSTELFRQEVMADFSIFVGQVFKDYDEEYHVGDLHFNPEWETYAATDYGFTNPSVYLLIQVGPWGEINVLGEIYQPGWTADQFADEIIRRRTRDGVPFNPPQLHTFYPDPADPMSSKTLSDKLRISAAGGTGGELNMRINIIRQWLKQGRLDYDGTGLNDGNAEKWRPRLMIDRSCTNLRREMQAYRYPERKDDAETSRDRFELPMKKDDHAPEALGRFAIGRFGVGGLTRSAGTRVRRANVGRNPQKRQGYNRTQSSPKPLRAMRPTASGYPEWRDEEFRRDYT
ncbi:terminase large subunit [Mycobacterium phage Onyinye]|uniref:Terminase n=1 Tax=Mycobacterium phage Onyinye TaxID=2686235 RepID=A0A6B9LHV8_9CAUD|nr:terminase large subunit [Mycobacterium phage Onyinye]QHB37424.1 terminase [Mycobacterium phage Onyinye]